MDTEESFSEKKWVRRLSLGSFKFSTKDAPFKLKGKVQKLVIKTGSWEDRKWNDRFLEIRGSTVQYCFWQNGIVGKVIDKIEVLHITRLSAFSMDLSDALDQLNLSISASFPQATWQQIVQNTAELCGVLQNCFLIRVESGNRMVRDYVIRTSTVEEAKLWVETIKKMVVHYSPPPQSILSQSRRILRPIIDSIAVQVFFGLIICLNFIAFMYETQVLKQSLFSCNSHKFA